MADMFDNNVLDLKKFDLLDDFIKDKLLREIIRIYYPDNLYLIDDNNINELLKAITSDKPNISIILPNNIKVRKEYDKLYFDTQDKKTDEYDYVFDKDIITPIGIIKYITDTSLYKEDKSNNIIRINSKDVKLPLHIRNKKNGDKISVKNMNGSKKVSDIFIDNKLSKQLRDIYPIVTDNDNNIIFIPGIKKSKLDVRMDKEYDIIIKYEWEEKNEEI
jgi:tRNA(Ile)-lysidine synthase